VLNAAIAKAAPALRGRAGREPADAEDEIAANGEVSTSKSTEFSDVVLAELVSQITNRANPTTLTAETRAERRPSARFRLFSTLPSEERARELTDIVRTLSPWAIRALVERWKRAQERAAKGYDTRVPWPPGVKRVEDLGPAPQELIRKGLLSAAAPEDSSRERLYGDLTDLGIEVGSLLLDTSFDESPEWLLELQRSWPS
jgi:hypothetical protein